jgi:hypothetical protein
MSMQHDQILEFEETLVGRSCALKRREHDWDFDLSDGLGLAVSTFWRIVADGQIALTSEDDGHKFGRSLPTDCEAEAHLLLNNKLVIAATLDKETADLKLYFDAKIRVDIFNNSSGYEGWQAAYTVNGKRCSLIALGGGGMALFTEQIGPPPSWHL